jgi:hypothetical protein
MPRAHVLIETPVEPSFRTKFSTCMELPLDGPSEVVMDSYVHQ